MTRLLDKRKDFSRKEQKKAGFSSPKGRSREAKGRKRQASPARPPRHLPLRHLSPRAARVDRVAAWQTIWSGGHSAPLVVTCTTSSASRRTRRPTRRTRVDQPRTAGGGQEGGTWYCLTNRWQGAQDVVDHSPTPGGAFSAFLALGGARLRLSGAEAAPDALSLRRPARYGLYTLSHSHRLLADRPARTGIRASRTTEQGECGT
jgi:hypothetical protein